MSFLPIVERELRAAARQRSTYRTRIAIAVLTSLFAAALILLENITSAKQIGITVFRVLASLAFLYCVFAGASQAADCLSEEKREGTLGLLFLTDLRGYDVVGAKLAASSVRAFQGLFAFFPILATGLILGGITAGEFWRVTAMLTSTLFLSIATGLWVSALSRESHRALAGTLGLLLLIAIVPLGAGWAVSRLWSAPVGTFLSSLSPAATASLAFDVAYRARPSQFWWALVLNNVLSWCLLFGASAALPYSWHDRPERAVASPKLAAHPGNDPIPRQQLRRRLLDINPILWLAARNERQRLFIWIFAACATMSGVLVLVLRRFLGGYTFGLTTTLIFALTLLLKLWVAWQACATLAEARRTGAIELMLATPLKIEEIIRGHWQALQRIFLWPLLAALALRSLPVIDAFVEQPPAAANLFLAPVPIVAVLGMATFVLDLIAIAWVGMWMGLTQPKSIQAFAKTVLFVIIIPAVVFCLPNFLFDLVGIYWARQKLEREFRKAAADRYAPSGSALVLPRVGVNPAPIPPVIAR